MARRKMFWAVYGQEEQPLCVAYAKTAGGAYSICEKLTGKSRQVMYAEPMQFDKGGYVFCETT